MKRKVTKNPRATFSEEQLAALKWAGVPAGTVNKLTLSTMVTPKGKKALANAEEINWIRNCIARYD